jgi:predicted DNA-binding transcriptional regulator AlpA
MKLPQVKRQDDHSIEQHETAPRFLRGEDVWGNKKKGVLGRVGLSRASVWRLRQQGLFPQPRQVSPGGAQRYLESDINRWIRERVERRDSGAEKSDKTRKVTTREI